jgi:hypothetical protein
MTNQRNAELSFGIGGVSGGFGTAEMEPDDGGDDYGYDEARDEKGPPELD